MLSLEQHKNIIADKGFSVIGNVFSTEEIENICEIICSIDPSKETLENQKIFLRSDSF